MKLTEKERMKEAYYQEREKGLNDDEAHIVLGIQNKRKHYSSLEWGYDARKKRELREEHIRKHPEDKLSREDLYELFRMGDTTDEIHECFPNSYTLQGLRRFETKFKEEEFPAIKKAYKQKREEGLNSEETHSILNIPSKGLFRFLEHNYSRKKEVSFNII